ncbi:gephyrin-like molybdotransferase receptor GlpR [uncultured Corynebacterium sp.]|uniref:divisome protein SepX/GlpR n=1 Tax=uncultured Corynebacterium sp. TaxID=159447 RepID=UPI0025CBDD45|nr:gephyrin-like molybdotransferase receptor GlpR [uncultured Corynebacterium sp.]
MSGSLLLIAAVWLVLLAPLLLRNQKPVRRTAQALSETRVLHRGGSKLNAKRKLKPAEGLYMASDDEELELVDAEPEYVLLEDEDSTAGATSGKARGLRAFMASRGSEDSKGRENSAGDAETEVVDGEVVDGEVVDDEVDDQTERKAPETDEGAVADAEKVVAASAVGSAVRYTAQDDVDTGEFSPVKKAAMSTADSEAAAEVTAATDGAAEVPDAEGTDAEVPDAEGADAEALDAEETEAAEEATARQAAYTAVPAEYVRGGDVKASPNLVDEVDAAPAGKSLDILEESDELSEADLKYLAARRGRGVYDPVASAQLARERQNRRKKVLLVLLALCALTFGTSLALGDGVWLTFVAMVAFTAFYLVMLRRQAIEERELRHRRLVRMRRARLGVRNTEDDELGVPDRLIRPGAVILETDEDDPAFSNLDYADGSDFFPAPGAGSDVATGYGAGTEGRALVADADEEYLDSRSGIRAV